ncbi:hypothetical protein GN244_ATG07977 [Phytophthora infestans]|uniref:Uncharacterized protein n=1 Tax=Phytophthora infestans TaxID=4787 RepID=A0A833SVZ7_PHYIN|nr:hypothetical protein GN244_ATG07977 [Phytophthora infestans]
MTLDEAPRAIGLVSKQQKPTVNWDLSRPSALHLKMSAAGGSDVVELVSSDESSSQEEGVDVVDLTASSEEDGGGDNEDTREEIQ